VRNPNPPAAPLTTMFVMRILFGQEKGLARCRVPSHVSAQGKAIPAHSTQSCDWQSINAATFRQFFRSCRHLAGIAPPSFRNKRSPEVHRIGQKLNW